MRIKINRSLRGENPKRWRIRQPVAVIESLQIPPNCRATKRVNNDNRLAFARKASVEHRGQAIGVAHFLRTVARDAKFGAALRVCRRGRATLNPTQRFTPNDE